MATFQLLAFGTEHRSGGLDVRYRSYTTSAKRAEAFKRIPKIPFTDSGHGIVFSVRELEYREKRQPTVTGRHSVEDHVLKHIKR